MEHEPKPKLKLTGQDGNAFKILAAARMASKKAKWTNEKWRKFDDEATSGNYENLLRTCIKYFDVD